MNKQLSFTARLVAIVALLLTLSAFAPGGVSMARAADPGTDTAAPDAVAMNGWVNASPDYQVANFGVPVPVYTQWGGQDTFDITIAIAWGDGSQVERYRCYSNCSSGNHTFTHYYNYKGDFWVDVWVELGQGGGDRVQVRIQ